MSLDETPERIIDRLFDELRLHAPQLRSSTGRMTRFQGVTMGSGLREAPVIDARLVASVLSEIAETASETLQLQDVIGRIAVSVRRIIPHDNMAVIRILDGEWAIKHAVSFRSEAK